MNNFDVYPIKLIPPCKDYIWGGTRLKTEYGKKSNSEKVAESWELSCHKDGESVIANGGYKGLTLSALIERTQGGILGENCRRFEFFPILIKLIDAHDNLSVQVHPENDYALRVEGEYGKTEMWYIIDAEPGAELLYGFKREISREEFEKRIRENTLLDVVNSVPVKKGDVFFIPSGTLHAIGKGILIAEIQQNSNTTYRIYDYGRLGADGKPRPLHIEKALDVTNRVYPPTQRSFPLEKNEGYTAQKLAECEYFSVSRLNIQNTAEIDVTSESFMSLLLLCGEAEIRFGSGSIRLGKGETAFIPASDDVLEIKGESEIILTTIPEGF